MQLTRWCAPVVVAVCVSFSVLIVNVRHVHGNGDEEQGRQDSGPGTMNVDGVSSSHHELQSNDLTLFDPVPVLSMHNATERAILKHLNLGQPFKLIGTAAEWPATGNWTLASLRSRFGKQVHNRYPDRGEPIFDEDGNFVEYFNPTDSEWEDFLKQFEEEEQDNSYIAWQCRNETASKELQSMYWLPSVLEQVGLSHGHYVSRQGARETVFIGTATGEAREAHIDYSCSNVWSAQLQGLKRWYLWSPLSCAGLLSSESGFDKCLATAKGLTTVLHPGDVIIWFAGWTHRTEILEAESVALSVEFDAPFPTTMLAEALPVFEQHSTHTGSYSHCLERWHRIVEKGQSET
eukprot:m.307865 g.307865  ORF g.307865 m.307865 type:complete len:348 (-) comp15938_c0_seq1:253-1296(-)